MGFCSIRPHGNVWDPPRIPTFYVHVSYKIVRYDVFVIIYDQHLEDITCMVNNRKVL